MEWVAVERASSELQHQQFALVQESQIREISKIQHFIGFTPLLQNHAEEDGGPLTLVSKLILFTHTSVRTLASLHVGATLELQSLNLSGKI